MFEHLLYEFLPKYDTQNEEEDQKRIDRLLSDIKLLRNTDERALAPVETRLGSESNAKDIVEVDDDDLSFYEESEDEEYKWKSIRGNKTTAAFGFSYAINQSDLIFIFVLQLFFKILFHKEWFQL